MTRRIAVLIALLLSSGAAMAQDAPRIVAVNHALAYFADRLVGEDAEVVYPAPEDVDPSFWRPSIADISAIQSSDLILLNGAGFATWVAKVSLPRSKLVTTSRGLEDQFITTETITHSHGDGGEHSHEGVASYTWLDPALAIAQAEAVASAIAARGLAPAESVYAELSKLQAEFEAVDTAANATLAPAQDVTMIATHPRYQYLARAYGLNILSLEWEAGAAPTEDQLRELGQMVEDSGAAVLIWEAEPSEEARAAVADLGLQDLVFPPLAVPVPGESYLGAYEAGIEAIADAASRAGSG